MAIEQNAKIVRFLALATHPLFKNTFKRISMRERAMCIAFLQQYGNLDNRGFNAVVNSWYLDKPKPKHFTDMWCLVSESI